MVFRAKIVDIHDESDFLTVKVGLEEDLDEGDILCIVLLLKDVGHRGTQQRKL